jgi:cation:H+ antiporter
MVGDSTAFQLGLVAVTVAGLWIGARLLVDSVVRLARRVGLSELTIGLTIVAAGTSTPELVVTIDAALKGFGDVAVGNALGSNVYNLAFVLGVVSLLRVVPIERSLVHRDGLVLIASALLGGVALLDATITRLEGLAFLGLYALYTASLLRTGDDSDGGRTVRDRPRAFDPTRRPSRRRRPSGSPSGVGTSPSRPSGWRSSSSAATSSSAPPPRWRVAPGSRSG